MIHSKITTILAQRCFIIFCSSNLHPRLILQFIIINRSDLPDTVYLRAFFREFFTSIIPTYIFLNDIPNSDFNEKIMHS